MTIMEKHKLISSHEYQNDIGYTGLCSKITLFALAHTATCRLALKYFRGQKKNYVGFLQNRVTCHQLKTRAIH